MRFVDWLAGRLAGRGTRLAFGVPGGGSSLDLLEALAGHDVRSVVTAREDAAVIMAGVAGMLAGAPGLAFTTKGPGLASATNGLACAALDRLPVLLVSEAFDPDELGYLTHQVFDQHALVAPLLAGPASARLEARTDVVDAWLGQWPSPPRGPAVLIAGAGDLAAPVGEGAAHQDPSPPAVTGDARGARALLARSAHPVLVAGLEATRGASAGAVRALAERLGAPVLCTYMGKGVVPDTHPLWAGVFTGGAIEQPCVAEADLVILAGLDPVELIRKPWSYAAPVLDLCEAVHEPHYVRPAARLVGPLERCIDALGDPPRSSGPEIGPEIGPESGPEIGSAAAHRERFLERMALEPAAGLDATTVVVTAARVLGPGRPRLAVDAGAHMFSACAFWPCLEPLDLLISNGLATMGFAVPAAIAAAAHEPARGAVAMTGDGGLLMCLGELKSAAELGAKVCIIVFNDARLSLIDIKREDRQMRDLGLSWSAPDFAATARGFGLRAWQARSETELEAALTAAREIDGPTLVDAHVDSAGYREQMRRLRG